MSGAAPNPRLAFCLEYPLATRGGVTVIVEELIRALFQDFQIWLISPEQSDEVLSSPLGPFLAGHIHFHLAWLPPSKAYHKLAQSLIERLQKEDIRIVHFHSGGIFGWGNRWPGASLPHACAKAGIKSLWSNHSTELPDRAFAGPGRAKWLSDVLAPLGRMGKASQVQAVDAEIAVSEHDRRYIEKHYHPGKALKRIYHSRLQESAQENEPVTREREPLVLAVGHVAYRKGQDILVRAFLEIAAQAAGWSLEIAGHDGGDGCWQEIQSLCESHPQGSRVKLLGAHPRPAELMERASILVQPSREEALGLAVQEALFLGCPAVGSRVGGIPEVIDEGATGLLVEAANVKALAAALLQLIADPAQRAEFGKRGHAAILDKGMTAPRMVEVHRALYLELLEQR